MENTEEPKKVGMMSHEVNFQQGVNSNEAGVITKKMGPMRWLSS